MQVRLKKAQKEAQRAEERAAEEREEAKLRDHYARKSLQSSMNYADMVGQNTGVWARMLLKNKTLKNASCDVSCSVL